LPVDPDVAMLIAQAAGSGQPDLTTMTPTEARAAFAASIALLAPSAASSTLSDHVVTSPGGPIPLRIYRPQDAAHDTVLPALIFLHGGGWVLGDLQTYEALCIRLSNRARIAVVAVDYRLAPEHRYPAAFEDAVAATRWIAAEGTSLGIDPGRLAIGGDSAGGSLAAATALAFRGAGDIVLRAQILLYPVTDLSTEHDSYRRNAEGYILTAQIMRWFRGLYLRDPLHAHDWQASPLKAKDLSRLPFTYILTCGFDPLCDEGILYARAVASFGTEVLHRHYDNLVHGFLLWGAVVGAARAALDEIADMLSQRLSA
jgi:acetyl esterase